MHPACARRGLDTPFVPGPLHLSANVRSIMAPVHLWLRAETKPNERRTHITPERCKDLVQAGMSASFIIIIIFLWISMFCKISLGTLRVECSHLYFLKRSGSVRVFSRFFQDFFMLKKMNIVKKLTVVQN